MRIGIVGTGFISSWLVAACRKVPGVEPAAIFSRSTESGERFAEENRLSRVHTDYAEMLACDDLDAIYVASPMKAHAEQSIQALDAGKHVLCEKTLGATGAEFEAIVAAADRNNKVVVEEIRPLFDPAWDVIRNNLDKLGTVRRAAFEKCQYSSRYDAFRRGEVLNAFKPELANSALGDIGVYCLQPALWVFGDPTDLQASSIKLSNGFDGAGSVLLDYGSHYAECAYSKISDSVRPSIIEGEDATMLIDSVAEPSTVAIRYRDGRVEEILSNPLEGPEQNLHHAVAGFVALCERGEVHHERLNISRIAMSVIDQVGAVLT